jgi:phosphoglycerate kinase
MKKKLAVISEIEVAGKNVLVRGDLEYSDRGSPRGKTMEEIVVLLKNKGAAKIKVLGHKGREEMTGWWPGVVVIWDIRADGREEADDAEFAQELAEGFDVYVNESFATSHRKHASLDALPRLMKSQGKTVCVGMRFAREIEVLDTINTAPFSADAVTLPPPNLGGGTKVLVIGGAKASDKEKASVELASKFDAILKGGLLSGVKLREDGLDISDEAIEEYIKVIATAGKIVVAGPMGKFEDAGSEKGTREVYAAVANSNAYKIAGGGETEKAIAKFGLEEKFDWISVGGGAMLEYLVKGTLPGIEAIVD